MTVKLIKIIIKTLRNEKNQLFNNVEKCKGERRSLIRRYTNYGEMETSFLDFFGLSDAENYKEENSDIETDGRGDTEKEINWKK